MKKKNGFFSMSIIYSFFLVFALISAVLLANYAHNRLLRKEFTDEIKTNLDDRGNDKLVSIKNRIENSSFEYDNVAGESSTWVFSTTTATFATNQRFDGLRSIALLAGVESNVNQKLKENVVNANHKYYFQCYVFNAGEQTTFGDFKISIRNNDSSKSYDFIKINEVRSYPQWTKLSGYLEVTFTGDTSNIIAFEEQPWYFTIHKSSAKNANASIYLDSLVLVDLTKSYGYGKEPSKQWLDANVEYFSDKFIHNRKDYTS